MNKLVSTLAILACALAVAAQTSDTQREQKKNDIRNMGQDTLRFLYMADPRAMPAVQNAAGYAVFSNVGMKFLLAGSGNGQGIAVNNRTTHETFMKMLEFQTGLGMRVNKFRAVFIFETEKALQSFVDFGWQFEGESTPATIDGDKNGSMAGAVWVSKDVLIFQLTESGMAAEIATENIRYSKDADLTGND
jgi:lipid-binding SYLF domain-containing protein